MTKFKRGDLVYHHSEDELFIIYRHDFDDYILVQKECTINDDILLYTYITDINDLTLIQRGAFA